MDNETIRIYIICATTYVIACYTGAIIITFIAPTPWYGLWSLLLVVNALMSAHVTSGRINDFINQEDKRDASKTS